MTQTGRKYQFTFEFCCNIIKDCGASAIIEISCNFNLEDWRLAYFVLSSLCLCCKFEILNICYLSISKVDKMRKSY